MIGLAAGFYAGSRAGEMVGCKTYAVPNGPTPCDEQGTKNMLLIIGTAGGGLAFGLLGAGLGKVWNWMN